MKNITDLQAGMNWERFLRLLPTGGFEVVMERKFGSGPSDIVLIAADVKRKLLLSAHPFGESEHRLTVNNIDVCGVLDVRGKEDEASDILWGRGCGLGGSTAIRPSGIVQFHMTHADAVFEALHFLGSQFAFVNWGQRFNYVTGFFFRTPYEPLNLDHHEYQYALNKLEFWKFLALARQDIRDFILQDPAQ